MLSRQPELVLTVDVLPALNRGGFPCGCAPSGVSVGIFDGLADVALYNEDVDRPGIIAVADRLRAEVHSADALLLMTPEYNGTMSTALKNAIDWPAAHTRFASVHPVDDEEIAAVMPEILTALAAAALSRDARVSVE
jgi:NAD(P)H-dependent FMN reductase